MIGTFALLLRMKGKKKIMGFVLFNRIKLVIKVNYYFYITIKIKLGKNFHEIDLKKSKMQSIEFFKQNVFVFFSRIWNWKSSNCIAQKNGKGSECRKLLHRKSKKEHQKSKITSKIRTSKVSIKRIRTSKDQNNDNYLWRSTYGYQGLWGVRLGS